MNSKLLKWYMSKSPEFSPFFQLSRLTIAADKCRSHTRARAVLACAIFVYLAHSKRDASVTGEAHHLLLAWKLMPDEAKYKGAKAQLKRSL